MIGGELIPQIYILYVLFSLYETNDGFHKHKNFTRRHFLKVSRIVNNEAESWSARAAF